MRERSLYPPVKSFLEAQGYEVKGEVNGCDLVAIRGEEAPVIVELKTTFSLSLVFQGIARQGCPTTSISRCRRSPAARCGAGMRWRYVAGSASVC